MPIKTWLIFDALKLEDCKIKLNKDGLIIIRYLFRSYIKLPTFSSGK